ncbi:MAG: hypothetical protein F7C35_06100 [Desulfurococcales archaeon]|nr:hypothetical protein [Desulfurococcales archaeon]
MRALIVGDRELIDYYRHVLGPDTLVVTREQIPDTRGARLHVLKTRFPPGARRGDVYREIRGTIDSIPVGTGYDLMIADAEAAEYSVITPLIAKRARPGLVLIEVTRLGVNTIAALKELSLESHYMPIVLLHGGKMPRSYKLRRAIYEALSTVSLPPGVYTFKLKRLKSYIRAWLWYYEAKDTITRARREGVPEYLVLDLETKVGEAERLLKGSEFTLVFPGVHDIKQPPPDVLYREAPTLFPTGWVTPVESKCYASMELVDGGLVVGCESRAYLNEEAIFLWIVKARPLPVWRADMLPETLAEPYTSYTGAVREGEQRIHPLQPSSFLEGFEARWEDVPLYSMDIEGMEEAIKLLAQELAPIALIASLAASCKSEPECMESVENAPPGLESAIRNVIENLEKYQRLSQLYKSIIKVLRRDGVRVEPPLKVEKISTEELLENLALLAWVLQAQLGIDPELADNLSIRAQDVALILENIRLREE